MGGRGSSERENDVERFGRPERCRVVGYSDRLRQYRRERGRADATDTCLLS